MEILATVPDGVVAAVALALLHAVWQDALLAAAAALTLTGMQRASAARRHAVAFSFLLAMALVPAVQFLTLWRWESRGGAGLLPAPAIAALGLIPAAFAREPPPLAGAIVLVWSSGVIAMLLRHVRGLRSIAALERGPGEPLPPYWRRRVDHLRGALGMARSVSVRLSGQVLVPCAVRLLKPVVLLPLSLLAQAPAAQVEALLAHELAHVSRRDWLWNGIQCVIEALLFFHPAVWWLGRRIRQEREHACDDLAVAACGDALALAEALAALEHERRAPARLALAAGEGALVRRIARLISRPSPSGRWGALGVLGVLAVPGVLLVTQQGMGGPELHFRASTAGALGPGDFCELTASGPDGRRQYRASVDVQGRFVEVYREDGEVRPIDATVRRWLEDVAVRNPLPRPEPPTPDSMHELQELFDLVAARADVVARLGSPVVATPAPVNGNVHLDGNDGDADIRIELRGPLGRSRVAVQADRKDRAWTLLRVEVP